MPPLSRAANLARSSSDPSVLTTIWSDSALLDPVIQERRRRVAADATYLSELARQTALMRWRGLVPDHRAG